MASLDEIRTHEQASPTGRILYVEGRTDPPLLAALVGERAVKLTQLVAVRGVAVVGRRGRASVEWGAAPDWDAVLGGYAPYAALNAVGARVREQLEDFGLARFRAPPAYPDAKHPELDLDALLTELEARGLPSGAAIAEDIRKRLKGILEGNRSMAVNGKWLLDVYAVKRTNESKAVVRDTWCDAVRSAGGHPQVRTWWKEHIG